MTTYNFQQLEQLWQQAGGQLVFAPIAAAVAIAESGGRSEAAGTNTNGSVDRGLWQINNQAHPNVSDQCAADPVCNATAAIAISGNGTNWRAWCTAWSDNACGTKGGTYLGAGSNAVAALKRNGGTFTPAPGGAPGGSFTANVPVGPQDNCVLTLPFVGCIAHQSTLRKAGGLGLMVAGGAVMLVGGVLLARQTAAGRQIGATVISVVPGASRAARRSSGGSSESFRAGEAPESAANRERHQGYVRQDRLKRREQAREEARQGVIRRRESARQERFEDAYDESGRSKDRGGA